MVLYGAAKAALFPETYEIPFTGPVAPEPTRRNVPVVAVTLGTNVEVYVLAGVPPGLNAALLKSSEKTVVCPKPTAEQVSITISNRCVWVKNLRIQFD
jgi:hypothetical protein